MISIFVRTVIIYVLLTVSLKIMGKRQIGELDVSELVSTLLISEIAAIPIDDPDLPLFNAVIPIIFILSLEIILSHLKTKHNKLKRYVEGSSVFVIYKGELNQTALKECRISINEFLSEMRNQGVADIRNIEYALIEQSGKISMIKSESGAFAHSIIIDGVIERQSLKKLGISEMQINKKLEDDGIELKEIFLMTVSDNGCYNIILKEKI